MKSFIAASVAGIAAAEVSVAQDSQFQQWTATNSRSWTTVHEYEFRRELWLLRDAAIEKHNANPKKSWTMGHNNLSDLTDSEYKKMLGGRYIPDFENAPVVGTCADNNSYCPSWASTGECTNNPGYMLTNCMLSCNQCNPTPPPPIPSDCSDVSQACATYVTSGYCASSS